MSNQIHSSAIISPRAELGTGNSIGPYAIIEDEVRLGNNNKIAAHAVIKRFCELGDNNQIHEQAVIGGWPQHTGFKDGDSVSYCRIGNANVIREAVTINRAFKPEASTLLGDRNYLMYSSHIGHDCQVGNDVTFAVSAGIAGHVDIGDKAFISGGVMVHQFVHIGRFAMVGGNAKITQDVLPFMVTDGNPALLRGLNIVGLKRAGFDMAQVKVLKQALRLLNRGGALADNLAEIQSLRHPLADELCQFVRAAERGFHRSR